MVSLALEDRTSLFCLTPGMPQVGHSAQKRHLAPQAPGPSESDFLMEKGEIF